MAAPRDRAAMLGDPRALILDEPVNGLDSVRRLAAEGRTVFLSSHVMREMAQGSASACRPC